MTDSVVAEGQVKLRDAKKWKTRWIVLRKPSPVADCLYLLVYKEKKKAKEKGSCNKERLNVTLEGICGVEPGAGYDGVSYTLSIICLAHTLVLGFNSRDALLAWDSRVCYSLGEVHRFSVNVEPGTKLESGPASLHLCNNLLVLTRRVPPVIIGHWKLSALRRYGAVPNGFVFEGGTRCGVWAGVFFLSSSEGEHINFLFDCIVRGITPSSRAPHGLRPALPADPNANPDSAEKRIIQEVSELEKRLSMLSICSLASSTASTYSFNTSVAGDDQSSISSSSSSQSDASYGSRLPFWVEPLTGSHPSNETASSTLKALSSSDDRLYAALMGNSRTHLSSNPLHPRALHDSGRQSSLDSGIGIATASQSSYSGSFSSFTGSLDTACQGGVQEFCSLTSLLGSPPPPLLPLSTPSYVPTSSPPSQSTLTLEQSSATSLCPCASRSSSSATCRHRAEYQIPSLLSRQYDTPRNLLQALSQRNTSSIEGQPELEWDSMSSSDGGSSQEQRMTRSPTGLMAQCQATMQPLHSWGSEHMLCVDSEGSSTPRPQQVPGGLDYGENQCSHGLDNYITPEQWRSARTSCVTLIANAPSGLSSSANIQDPPVCARQKHKEIGEVVDTFAGQKRTEPSRPPSAPPPLPFPLRMHNSKTVIGKSSHEAPLPVSLENGLQSNSTVNYVNIPIIPLPAKTHREPLYAELDLQGTGSVSVLSAVRRTFLQL